MADGKPRTPEEVVALARARASLGELPEGVQVDFMFMDEEEQIRQMHENDAMAFLPAKDFAFTLDDGAEKPLIEVEFQPIAAMVAAGRVTCEHYGIGVEFPVGNPVPPFALFRLVVDGRYRAPINISLEKAPGGFIDSIIELGLYVAFSPPEGGPGPYIKIGPMRRFDQPVEVKPTAGRNDPCPCGSGLKFKRCHGR